MFFLDSSWLERLLIVICACSIVGCEKEEGPPASASAPPMCAEGFEEYVGSDAPEFDVNDEDIVFLLVRFSEVALHFHRAYDHWYTYLTCRENGPCKLLTSDRENYIDRCEKIEVLAIEELGHWDPYEGPLYQQRASHDLARRVANFLDGRVEARCPIDLYYSPQPDVWCQKRVRQKITDAAGE